MNKGQSAIMDALFFMIICSVSATLLFYVSSLYGQSVDQEISAIYNFEYTGNALLSLMNVDDGEFWRGVQEKVENNEDISDIRENISSYKNGKIWEEVLNSSPTNYTFLCFKPINPMENPDACGNSEGCYPANYTRESSMGGNCDYRPHDPGKPYKCKESDFSTANFTSYTHSVVVDSGCGAFMVVYY